MTGCSHTAVDAFCDDGNVGSGAGSCVPSNGHADPATGCLAGTNAASGTMCPADAIPCTVDACNGMGQCLHTPTDSLCNDNKSCTADSCDVAMGGCVNLPNHAACSTGNSCTSDTCNPRDGRSNMTTGCLVLPRPSGTACTPDSVACTR